MNNFNQSAEVRETNDIISTKSINIYQSILTIKIVFDVLVSQMEKQIETIYLPYQVVPTLKM